MNEKEFYVWAGKRHKVLREAKGITQDELTAKTGFDRSLISKFENTGKKISTFRMKQSLEAMGYSLSDLDPSSEKKTPSTSIYPCQPVMV